MHKIKKIKLASDFSTQTPYNKRKRSKILQKKKCEPRILYSEKLTFKYKVPDKL